MTSGWHVPAPGQLACLLCGHVGPVDVVAWALIRWPDGEPFSSGPRCRDEWECSQRRESNDRIAAAFKEASGAA